MHQIPTGLETGGLVIREQSADHDQVRLASFTPEGRRLVDECDAAVDLLEDEVFAGLTPGERRTLRDLMDSSF